MRSQIARTVAVIVLLAALLAAAPTSPLKAHEGHDHGAPATPVSSTIAPRADASSADFELVVVARDGKLTLYLDTFKGNLPVAGAALEIDAPGGVLTPREAAPGVYAAEAPFLQKAGSYDLAITVSAEGLVDVLTATLKTPETAVARGQSTTPFSWGVNPATAQELKKRLPAPDLPAVLWIVIGVAGGIGATLLFMRVSRKAPLLLLAALPWLGPTPADADELPQLVAARDISQRFADGALFVPKSTQRILAIATAFTEQKSYRRALELPGRIIAAASYRRPSEDDWCLPQEASSLLARRSRPVTY